MKHLFTFVLLISTLICHSQVLINQIYGGGGNIGATWTHDVVQLINIGSTPYDLSNYAIQYASESGNSWNVDPLPSGTSIGAGAILNILLSSGSNGNPVPSPFIQAIAAPGGQINMSARAGKVALTDNTTALSGSGCPSSAVDYVGFGTTGAQTCGPHTTSTIPASNNTSGYLRSNTLVPGSFDIYSTPLPVNFSNFSISAVKNTSIISFSTASETNNDYFTIERSADGRSFDAIGEIKGAGNSNTALTYAYTDEKPYAGINFYRIKQTDYDGKYSYSDIKSVRHNTVGALNITPRTTEGRLQVTTDIEAYSLDVYNVAGQQVKSFQSLSQDQYISIDDLTAGLYFIRINHSGQVETTKIVKI